MSVDPGNLGPNSYYSYTIIATPRQILEHFTVTTRLQTHVDHYSCMFVLAIIQAYDNQSAPLKTCHEILSRPQP